MQSAPVANDVGKFLAMKIGGISILLITGIINALLILFQAGTGLRYIKVPFGIHKKTGIALILFATIHAVLAILS
jgi:cytochrome b subunit of formate dehydrogenase